MLKRILVAISLTLPAHSYADDVVGYLVNKTLAKDAALDYGVGKVNGPVKRLVIWNELGNKIISYDDQKRITSVENKSAGDYTKIYYGINGNLPLWSSTTTRTSNKPMETTYTRDLNGNIRYIISSNYDKNGIKKNNTTVWNYKNSPNGVVEVSFPKSSILGNRKAYYKDGLIIKEVSEDAKGINSNLEYVKIPKSESRYQYKFSKSSNEPIFISQQEFNSAGKLTSKISKEFSTKGYKTKVFLSSIGNPNIGTTIKYIDYKFDKYSNWTERNVCTTRGQSTPHTSCRLEERTISYY